MQNATGVETDVSGLRAGLYLLRATRVNGSTITAKIVVAH
jgi:hypothetical protein